MLKIIFWIFWVIIFSVIFLVGSVLVRESSVVINFGFFFYFDI